MCDQIWRLQESRLVPGCLVAVLARQQQRRVLRPERIPAEARSQLDPQGHAAAASISPPSPPPPHRDGVGAETPERALQGGVPTRVVWVAVLRAAKNLPAPRSNRVNTRGWIGRRLTEIFPTTAPNTCGGAVITIHTRTQRHVSSTYG